MSLEYKDKNFEHRKKFCNFLSFNQRTDSKSSLFKFFVLGWVYINILVDYLFLMYILVTKN